MIVFYLCSYILSEDKGRGEYLKRDACLRPRVRLSQNWAEGYFNQEEAQINPPPDFCIVTGLGPKPGGIPVLISACVFMILWDVVKIA